MAGADHMQAPAKETRGLAYAFATLHFLTVFPRHGNNSPGKIPGFARQARSRLPVRKPLLARDFRSDVPNFRSALYSARVGYACTSVRATTVVFL
ncbi:protein of unknown function (plasmid) [Paraburkholderia kururiensis]